MARVDEVEIALSKDTFETFMTLVNNGEGDGFEQLKEVLSQSATAFNSGLDVKILFSYEPRESEAALHSVMANLEYVQGFRFGMIILQENDESPVDLYGEPDAFSLEYSAIIDDMENISRTMYYGLPPEGQTAVIDHVITNNETLSEARKEAALNLINDYMPSYQQFVLLDFVDNDKLSEKIKELAEIDLSALISISPSMRN